MRRRSFLGGLLGLFGVACAGAESDNGIFRTTPGQIGTGMSIAPQPFMVARNMNIASGNASARFNMLSGNELSADGRGMPGDGMIRTVSMAVYYATTGAELSTQNKSLIWLMLFRNGEEVPITMAYGTYGTYGISANNFGPGNDIVLDIPFRKNDILSYQFYQGSGLTVVYDLVISGTYL